MYVCDNWNVNVIFSRWDMNGVMEGEKFLILYYKL